MALQKLLKQHKKPTRLIISVILLFGLSTKFLELSSNLVNNNNLVDNPPIYYSTIRSHPLFNRSHGSNLTYALLTTKDEDMINDQYILDQSGFHQIEKKSWMNADLVLFWNHHRYEIQSR